MEKGFTHYVYGQNGDGSLFTAAVLATGTEPFSLLSVCKVTFGTVQELDM